MTEGAAWRPIRHMSIGTIGAQIQIRTPTVDGHLMLTGPFTVHTLHAEPGWTLGGHPVFETVVINESRVDRFAAYDGDEYREIPN